MQEVRVTLDFNCCVCEGTVYVTLQCMGTALSMGSRMAAVVKVPCPNCGCVNQLCFEPKTGIVHEVKPCDGSPRGVPVPSLN